MNIAILGFAGQGKSTYEYLSEQGHNVTICDKNTDLEVPEGASSKLGEDSMKGLEEFDQIYRTPVIHPQKIVEANSPEILKKVTSNTNEFFKVCPTKSIIGVTGTKGKGTTSTLITEILRSAGKKVHLGGNIGTPPLELLKDGITEDDWVILELANFQLIDLKHSPKMAVCLMVEPEHMDWHESMAEYLNAKKQLFTHQTKDDISVYYSKNRNSVEIASAGNGQNIPYFEAPGAYEKDGYIWIEDHKIINTDDIKLPGEHNWQNVCAALTAVWQITQDFQAITSALKKFSGLPFRIEKRRTVNSVSYYDDSFATAPGATIAAINALREKKVLIIGGYERGLSLERLADTINDHKNDIRKVLLIGASAGRVRETLEQKGFSNYVEVSSKNMRDIVKTASEYAHKGDSVVLSPAFASFDMFKNFEERGLKFNQAVEEL